VNRHSIRNLLCAISVLSIVFIDSTSMHGQDKPRSKMNTPAEFKVFGHYVPNLVRIIEELGDGRVDEAVDLLIKESPAGAAKEGKGPFETATRATWTRDFGRFAAWKPQFENVEFVGYRKLSTQAYNLVFIGNSRIGPVQIHFDVFMYRNRWYTNGYLFYTDWRLIEKSNDYTRFEEPIVYNLPLQRIAERKQSSNTK